jgi:UDP-4-amino-4,6-dideoxy-N-acetyl-beta-L-altrosamine transaminase
MQTNANVPQARQHIADGDIDAVAATLRSDWLTSGPAISAFEEQIASRCGARFGVAVSSGTAALHAACRAAGIGPGDRVWTSPNSFVASANCALYCEAAVDFVDIDPRSYNIGVDALERKLSAAARENTLPKALIAVHFAGLPCDLEAIAALTQPHGISIIEDASHALGATYSGEPVGAGRYSVATTFSFYATKSIATGEGGAIATNREDLAQHARRFRSHGITPHTSTDEPWLYEQRELGYNYRMTEMQAALGANQLRSLEAFVARRNELAKRYDEALNDLNIQLPRRDPNRTSAWHLYPVQMLAADPAATRRKLYFELLRHGIRSQVNYIPIHTQPFYRDLGFRSGQFPAAERYYQGALSLPLFVDLREDDQDRVIEVVRSVLTGQ